MTCPDDRSEKEVDDQRENSSKTIRYWQQVSDVRQEREENDYSPSIRFCILITKKSFIRLGNKYDRYDPEILVLPSRRSRSASKGRTNQ
jgi:hypothetical protein